jgi:signal peptidase I
MTRKSVVFEGNSMLPSIKNGQRLYVEQLDAKTQRKLARGDILVFKYPKDPSKGYIKRLIGLPGDKVEIQAGEVWVNGSKLSEPYVDSKTNLSQTSQPTVVVPTRSYYVLGDNRDNSSDSRSWGFVPEELLIAKVVKQ